MRIGFIGNVPPPIGGAEVFLREFLTHFIPRGHRDAMLIRWRKQVFQYFPEQVTRTYLPRPGVRREFGVPVHYLLEGQERSPRESYQAYYARLETHYLRQALPVMDRLAQHRVELIHCHMIYPNLLFAGMAAQALSVPLVLTVHGLLEFRLLDFVRRYAPSLVARVDAFVPKAEHVIATSPEIARACRQRGARSVSVLGGGIGAEWFRAAGAPRGRDLVFVGSVRKAKGAEVLIRAFEHLDGGFDGRLLFVGRPLLEGAVVNRARRNPRIRFLGEQPAPAVRQIMQRARLVVLPSASEGLPISILEAMASKKPVLVTRTGALPQVIRHGSNGFLITSRAPAALAAQIRTVTERADLDQIGARARRTAQRFDIRRLVDRYDALYQRVVN